MARPGERKAAVILFVACGLAVLAMTWLCQHLLDGIRLGGPIGSAELLLYGAAAIFLIACGAVVVVQAVHMRHQLVGPERRLIEALQQIRSGDVSFRVHLRRGDLLSGLAAECNHMIEWLNAHPPNGVRTGSDVVEVELDDSEAVEVAP